jgi:transposase
VSLQPEAIAEIPQATVRVAKAAFPNGNLYMQMRDQLGTIYQDTDFKNLFPPRGQPAENPWRLALVLVFQFVEGLTDRQAAEAVRARIDWKYALSLQLGDPGFHYSVLSEFRARLLSGSAQQLLLDKMLEHFKTKGYLKARGKQRTDSTHVLAAVRRLNRLETVAETLRAALNSLALAAPLWLQSQVTTEWFERYGRRVEEYRLPKGEQARADYAALIGADGFRLLRALETETAPPQLRELESIKVLGQTWEQQFIEEDNRVRLRKPGKELAPAGERIDSPYDPQARFSTKRSVAWVGYKVHLTETCDKGSVHLVTQVETTNACLPDVEMGEKIQEALAQKQLLPTEHYLDRGYIDAQLIVDSKRKRGVKVVGPARENYHWQAHTEGGFDLSRFQIDWDNQRVTCPAGEESIRWAPNRDGTKQELIKVRFKKVTCLSCRHRPMCTRSKGGPREFLLRPREQHEALVAARQEQQTAGWKNGYDCRAGVEGTISQGVRAFGLRQARYKGQAKTHLQNVVTAAALNLSRVVAWINEIPREKTRRSHFAKLGPDMG